MGKIARVREAERPGERVLAEGAGWRVTDVVCDRGPRDRVFVEQHEHVNVAVVERGTFQYRTAQGAALLGPGAVLLGNPGACFECAHEHGQGDRCLAFRYSPELFEDIVAATPGARRTTFVAPRLPPQAGLARAIATAEAAREVNDVAAFEELVFALAGAVVRSTAAARNAPTRRIRPRDEQRISDVVRVIDRDASLESANLSLGSLAQRAGMSPYHFLRVFSAIVGMTPHRYILARRLHQAAVSLRISRAPVAQLAYEAGFGDLSTFNRRFREVMGEPPGAFRRPRRAAL